METSILKSIKNVLGVTNDYTAFDLMIIMHINSVFSTLKQLGVGPDNGFEITDDTAVWSDFISEDDKGYNLIKSYISLKVRMLFDPPNTSFVISAVEKQISEFEWRISNERETNLISEAETI